MTWSTDEFTGRRLGRYELLCRLAVGGMAELFLGFARSGPSQGRPVVLKRILPDLREEPAALRMLIDEARLTATLSHPNIAQVLDLERDGEDVALVIEFIPGADVEEVADVYRERGEPVPLGFALAVGREAAQALAHAHAHRGERGEPSPVIHRDVTPRNVMVDFEGAIKVLDFGIARAKGIERRTVVGMVRGTTSYMSPEQAVGGELDPRTDLFSLGVLCHELLTGQRLFARATPGEEMAAVYEGEIPLPSRVNRRVPRAVDPVVMRALERPLERRTQSALDFIRDLSLAAGSTMWGHERCAELMQAQFAARRILVEQLLARVPGRPRAASEGPTQIGRGGPAAAGYGEDLFSDSSRTQEAMPAQPSEPRGEAVRPVAEASRRLPSAAPRRPEVEAEGRGAGAGPTHALPARPGPVPPASGPAGEVGHRAPVASRAPLLASLVAGLALGTLAGALGARALLQAPGARLGQVAIRSDRPAQVLLGPLSLGWTPVVAVLPVGRQVLLFQEDGGQPRALVLEVLEGVENPLAVELDTLPGPP
jgi:hypothetical protein